MPEIPLSLNVELRSRNDAKSITGKITDSGTIGIVDRPSEAASIIALVPPGSEAANYDVYVEGRNTTKKVNDLLGRAAFAQAAASFSYYKHQLLKNPDPKERCEAISRLVHFAKAEGLFFYALKNDSVPEVRSAAAHALGRRKAAGELRDDGQAGFLLVNVLKNDLVEVQVAAVEALGEIKSPEALQTLITASDKGVPEVRSAAVKALGGQNNDQAKQALLEASSDPDPTVRAQAIESLNGYRTDPRVEKCLKEALNDPDGRIRSKAVWALGFYQDHSQAITPFLVAMLKNDRNTEVKKAAVLAVGNLGDPSAVKPLLETLEDPNAEVAGYAVWMLGKFSDPQVPPVLRTVLQGSTNTLLRMGAVKGLGELKNPLGTELLSETLLNDPEPKVWKEAVLALENLKAVEPLIAVLKSDRAPEVRIAVAMALGNLGDQRAGKPLAEARKDKNAAVAEAASIAIAKLPPL